MEMQELISRGRLLFHGASKRFDAFKLVNGRRSAKEIAKNTGRSLANTLHDLRKMRDLALIRIKVDKSGKELKKSGSTVFEKAQLLNSISLTYFSDPIRAKKRFGKNLVKVKVQGKQSNLISVPDEKRVLDICRTGEDQLYEFKSAGVETKKITKEICAFANTKLGGIIFYGIEDDGAISGSDKHRQKFDQSLRNSIHSTISPSLIVDIKEKDLCGQKVLLVMVPGWNKKDIYYYEGRVYIRKGTNVFIATPEECKKLHAGVCVI
jgi:hypothetical protein